MNEVNGGVGVCVSYVELYHVAYMTNNGINALPLFSVQFKFLANLDPSKRTETIVMLMK